MKPEAFSGPWRFLFHSQLVGNPAFGYYRRERNMLFTPAMILDHHKCAVSVSDFWFVKKEKRNAPRAWILDETDGWGEMFPWVFFFAALLRKCPEQSIQQSGDIGSAEFIK